MFDLIVSELEGQAGNQCIPGKSDISSECSAYPVERWVPSSGGPWQSLNAIACNLSSLKAAVWLQWMKLRQRRNLNAAELSRYAILPINAADGGIGHSSSG
jgi:hypothetical protein